MKNTLALVVLVAFVGLFASPKDANASVFKCVDASGSVSYIQTPCPAEEETAKVIATKSAAAEQHDCRIANNFARKTAMQMRTGQSSGELFNEYGGIDALPRTSIGVINYVYTHRQNPDVDPQRIVALSAARCSAGSYGRVTCDDFPYSFVSELGGCEAAGKSMFKQKPEGETTAATTKEPAGATGQVLGAKTSSPDSTNKKRCQDDIQSQLTALFSSMGGGESATDMNEIDSQRGELQNQLSSC